MQTEKNKTRTRPDAETFWDERADRFNEYQQTSKSTIEDQVMGYLDLQGVLDGAKVLDIGGGSGRYALPLAKRAREVVMTDISGKMLTHAKHNAVAASLDNIRYEKLDWSEADLEALGWKGHFDLVFASMCPALRTAEGLQKMLDATGGYGFINQFIKDYDSVTRFVEDRLVIKRDFDPHNDRENALRLFGELWEKGLNPQVAYTEDVFSKQMSRDEVLEILSRDYGERAKEQGVDLSELLNEYQAADPSSEVTVNGQTVSMMIFWKA